MGRTLKSAGGESVPDIGVGHGVTRIPQEFTATIPEASESIEENIAKMNGKDLDSLALQVGIEVPLKAKINEKREILLDAIAKSKEEDEDEGLQQNDSGTDESVIEGEGSGDNGS